jgi:hypothetical protein
LLFWLADDVKPGSQHYAGWQTYSLIPCYIFTSNGIFQAKKETTKMEDENK